LEARGGGTWVNKKVSRGLLWGKSLKRGKKRGKTGHFRKFSNFFTEDGQKKRPGMSNPAASGVLGDKGGGRRVLVRGAGEKVTSPSGVGGKTP